MKNYKDIKERIKKVQKIFSEKKKKIKPGTFSIEDLDASKEEIEDWIRTVDNLRQSPTVIYEHLYPRICVIKSMEFDNKYDNLLKVNINTDGVLNVDVPQNLIFDVKNPLSSKAFDEFCLTIGFSKKTGKGFDSLKGKKIKIETIVYEWWLDEIIGESVIGTITYFFNRDGWRIDPHGMSDVPDDFVLFQHFHQESSCYFDDDDLDSSNNGIDLTDPENSPKFNPFKDINLPPGISRLDEIIDDDDEEEDYDCEDDEESPF